MGKEDESNNGADANEGAKQVHDEQDEAAADAMMPDDETTSAAEVTNGVSSMVADAEARTEEGDGAPQSHAGKDETVGTEAEDSDSLANAQDQEQEDQFQQQGQRQAHSHVQWQSQLSQLAPTEGSSDLADADPPFHKLVQPLPMQMDLDGDGDVHAATNQQTPIRSNHTSSILRASKSPEENRELYDAHRSVSFRSDPEESGQGSSVYSQPSLSDGPSFDDTDPIMIPIDEQETAAGDRPSLLGSQNQRRSSKFHVQESNRRVSLTTDLETGKTGGRMRQHEATIRSVCDCEPQNELTRRRRGVQKVLGKVRQKIFGEESEDSADDESLTSVRGRLIVSASKVPIRHETRSSLVIATETDAAQETQYTLKATQTVPSTRAPFGGNVMYEVSPSQEEKGSGCFGIRLNVLVHRYLNWAFRETFMKVFLSAAIIFFTWTLVFAVLIFWSGHNKPQCIHVNGVDFGSTDADFMDAYALSWTTFSTVGYGLVYPSTSSVYGDVSKCTGITILTTLESFVGILYASFCGAIMFAKVTRIASFAQVTFSDPIVIRYGKGIAAEEEEEEVKAGGDAGNSKEFELSKLPCPLLEFRVVNRLAGQLGGEIIDATMNIVASIDEKQAEDMGGASTMRRKGGKKGKRRRRVANRRRSSSNFVPPSRKSYDRVAQSVRNMFATSLRHDQNQAIVEDPTGKVVPRRIFAKLDIDSAEHPFFKRLWLVRHVLNENSPLLKRQARELVRMNGGNWPQELNNADGVRSAIDFDQILVSLSGTSNVDANSVYAQKAYDYVDICVGYRFCNILFRNEDGTLGVDQTLLNDVTEQSGGGGENLTEHSGKHVGDIFVL